MAMCWYAVHTLSGSEDRAMQALKQRISMNGLDRKFGQVLVPSETVVDPKSNRKITRRFYPGYMLVQMHLDNETWHLVNGTPKVTGFVGDRRNPPPVPETEVLRITELLREEDEPKAAVNFGLGEEVRLTDGSYASMRGVVREINQHRGRLRVEINIFGRPVSTELSFHQVEKLA